MSFKAVSAERCHCTRNGFKFCWALQFFSKRTPAFLHFLFTRVCCVQLFSVLILDLRPRQKGTFCVFHLSDLTQTDCVSIQICCGQNKLYRVEKYRLLESETLRWSKRTSAFMEWMMGRGGCSWASLNSICSGILTSSGLFQGCLDVHFKLGVINWNWKNTNKDKYFINWTQVLCQHKK